MSDARDLVARLAAHDHSAWPEFLEKFAPILLQVAREVERDADAAADAFLFICEHLSANDARRLRQFDPSVGGASFTTWLRVVAWNLALDARRKRRGRFRPLAAIGRLPVLQQRVYRLMYEEGLTSDQAFAVLRPEFPGLSRTEARGAESEVDRVVGSRQRWVLTVRRPLVESLDSSLDGELPVPDPVDAAPDPEAEAMMREQFEALQHALDDLPPLDRLLVQLRFEQDLTLGRIATLLGFKDPWVVHRQLDRVVKALRSHLDAKSPPGSV